MTDRFIVGFDGSKSGERGLDFAVARAKAEGASLCVVHVIEWSPYSFHTPEELAERHKRREEELQRAHDALLEPAVKRARAAGVSADGFARHGHVAETLAALAKEQGAKQIFVGRTGTTSFQERLFGSVPSTLVQVASVPVTVVP